MTTEPTTTPDEIPSHDALVGVLVDLLVDTPQLFATIGEVLRLAAPLIAARRDLDNMPEAMEP